MSRAGRTPIWTAVLTVVPVLLAANGCGESSSTASVAPSSVERCGATVAGSGSTVPAGGGTGTLTVTVQRECSWSARSESPWISLAGGEGQGPATITYSVQPNPNASSRRGKVVVAQQSVEIAQEAAPCRYDVSPSTVDAVASGATVGIAVAAPGGCSWTAESGVPWITPAPPTGQGNGTVQVTITRNTAAVRTGSFTIAGRAVTVRQPGSSGPPSPPSPGQGCRYNLKPSEHEAKAEADDFKIEVKTEDGCPWTASSPVTWVRITEGSRGSGEGDVRILIAANTGSARSTTLAIAGRTFTLSQKATKK